MPSGVDSRSLKRDIAVGFFFLALTMRSLRI